MVKFLDLKKINDRFTDEFTVSFNRILSSGWYLLGDENRIFEEAYSEYCGVRHTIGCANGLDALKLIIQAYGWGGGMKLLHLLIHI